MSISEDQAILLEKVTKILLGTHDFRALAEKSVDLVVKELKAQGLVGAAVFRVHQNENKLYAYAFSTKYTRAIEKLLPSRFANLSVALTETHNLTVRTVNTGQIQHGKHLQAFSHNVLPDGVSSKVQMLMKAKSFMSFPIATHNRIAGAILFASSAGEIDSEQITLFETFARQLALAFSNVFAFEKLMHQYQQKFKSENDPDNIPSVKFTLRITPAEDKKLDALARARGKTKAELIREFLDRI